ncbi:hypothetical protein CfE428DRAFT_1866 [Chthoniobacter flavus Ellin428]|uniref:Uncharacterized protein n=1 Tax=Chthoniobacter flavus Ellin428 TaxID=497964 RepID=B4CYX8_9BACT|nr:hypothetical protein CfE428DRAFT_1866 [Chthoniobacter flavus Ellin428]
MWQPFLSITHIMELCSDIDTDSALGAATFPVADRIQRA